MRPKQRSFALISTFVVVAVALAMMPAARSKPKYKVLASIPGGLWSGLTFDSKGNLYGVTTGGGDNHVGSIFEMTRDSKGRWTVTTLHSFDGTDGSSPNGNLIFDAAGNLYGTTPEGGTYDGGTVFQLTPSSGGWTFGVLYNFCEQYGCPDGGGPLAGVVQDKDGNLLGTARAGVYGLGVVFELTLGSNGWNENVLYSFGSRPHDGSDPMDSPVLDAKGNIYGSTYFGGRDGDGTVFKMRLGSKGWRERLLLQFNSNDGAGPEGGEVFDTEGNLYGTTNGGASNIFELTPEANGSWKETVLYHFRNPENGLAPVSGLVGGGGILYGTTAIGGNGSCFNGCGVVYKLAPRADGKWRYTVLHKFGSPDESPPDGKLILDAKGNLYGTALSVVYEITP
jgi:uncharacterized repeat protein (TIGR03803 family)